MKFDDLYRANRCLLSLSISKKKKKNEKQQQQQHNTKPIEPHHKFALYCARFRYLYISYLIIYSHCSNEHFSLYCYVQYNNTDTTVCIVYITRGFTNVIILC